MKSTKSRKKYKKVEKTPDKPCMCEVHIRNDATLKDPIPCVGHGPKCPCVIKKLEEEKTKEETTTDPSPQQT